MNSVPEDLTIVLRLDQSLSIVGVEDATSRDWRWSIGSFFADLISARDRVAADLVLRSAQGRKTVDRFVELKLSDGLKYGRLRMRPSESGWIVRLDLIRPLDAVYQLVATREQYEALFRSSQDGIASLDAAHRVLDHNERFFELMAFRSTHGVPLNEAAIRGQDVLELCRHAPELACLEGLLFASEETPRATARMTWRGRQLEVQVVPTRAPHFGRIGSALLVHDRSAEAKLEVVLGELAQANERLAELAIRDPLTSLLNRRGIERALESSFALANRTGFRISALLVDVDDFKAVNGLHGHAAGDRILTEIAGRLRANTRSTDIVGRVGGDEFLVVLPGTGLSGAVTVGDSICSAIKDERLSTGTTDIEVSASLGAAELSAGSRSIEDILRLIRGAIERSKLGGKARVSVAEPG